MDYARRLFARIRALQTIQWISNADRTFAIHADQDFVFGPTELAGLKIFFTGPGVNPPTPLTIASGGAGNCIACHAPPAFTDFAFHNTIEDVLEFYRAFGEKARAREVRNPAPELRGIVLKPHDLPPLAAFLRALNEDYE